MLGNVWLGIRLRNANWQAEIALSFHFFHTRRRNMHCARTCDGDSSRLCVTWIACGAFFLRLRLRHSSECVECVMLRRRMANPPMMVADRAPFPEFNRYIFVLLVRFQSSWAAVYSLIRPGTPQTVSVSLITGSIACVTSHHIILLLFSHTQPPSLYVCFTYQTLPYCWLIDGMNEGMAHRIMKTKACFKAQSQQKTKTSFFLR